MKANLKVGDIVSFGKDQRKFEVMETGEKTAFRLASPSAIRRHEQKHLLIAKVNLRLAQLWMNGWLKRA